MRRRGLSTRALGAALDVSNGTVAAWKKGAMPRPDVATRLAEFFQVPVDALLDDTLDLPLDRTEQRFTQAHQASDVLEEPTAKEAVFLRTLERTQQADFLRQHARRLIDQAQEMHKWADTIDPVGAKEREEASAYLEALKQKVGAKQGVSYPEGRRHAK